MTRVGHVLFVVVYLTQCARDGASWSILALLADSGVLPMAPAWERQLDVVAAPAGSPQAGKAGYARGEQLTDAPQLAGYLEESGRRSCSLEVMALFRASDQGVPTLDPLDDLTADPVCPRAARNTRWS